jgi:hypothetical protein
VPLADAMGGMPAARTQPLGNGQRRRLLSVVAACGFAGAQLACGSAFESPVGPDGFGAGGFGAADGGFTGAGGTSLPGTGGTSSCEVNLYGSALDGQRVDPFRTRSRVLYGWMTQEEEDALRAGGPVLNLGAETEEGRGFGLEQLFAWAVGHPDSLEASVATYFERARVAWTHPWATRITIAGEDAGSRLVRLELEPDAWVGRLARHGEILEFYDLDGGDVTFEQAAATPQRVALLYFLHLGEEANLVCGGDRLAQGEGYRHLIVGNEDMIKRYEVGSQPVLQRLMDDTTALSEYLELIRPCPPPIFEPFAANVICNWSYNTDPYLSALSYPTEAYRPTASKIADVIELLEDSLFEVDPFIVEQAGLEP